MREMRPVQNLQKIFSVMILSKIGVLRPKAILYNIFLRLMNHINIVGLLFSHCITLNKRHYKRDIV